VKEKQFDRKVEINAELRKVKTGLEEFKQSQITGLRS
jgi:hypothetical protein